MLRARKGNELSMNTMIIAALAIMVLLLSAYFLIKAALNTNNSTDCEKQNGICWASSSQCPDDKPVPGPNYCADNTKRCCINIGELGVPKK